MASIALSTGGYVRGGLAKGLDAVMASGACAGGAGAVHIGGSCPTGGGCVAGVALRRGADVGGVLGLRILTQIGTAVAGGAIACCQWAGCAGMAHGRRSKSCAAVMAGAALSGSRDMFDRFANCCLAVVAAGAAGVAGLVRITLGCPAASVVATVTAGSRGDVVTWFAGGPAAIVTGCTATADVHMVKAGRKPSGYLVA